MSVVEGTLTIEGVSETLTVACGDGDLKSVIASVAEMKEKSNALMTTRISERGDQAGEMQGMYVW